MKDQATLLSVKQFESILAIMDASNITEGLTKAGVSRSTFYRWKRNPAFKREWEGFMKECYERACTDFVNLGDKALRAYEERLESQNEMVSLSAAKSYYAQITKWKEIEYREKHLERSENKADVASKNWSPRECISLIVDGAILPDPFMYIQVSKLPPTIWKRIVSMDLYEDEWESLSDSLNKADKITIYSMALKCLLELVSSSDTEIVEIFKKLIRQVDSIVSNVLISETWHKLINKLASFELADEPTEPKRDLTPTTTQGSEPQAPQHLKRRSLKLQHRCDPTANPEA